MKLFSFGANREKVTLIFDIQSSVVRGAIVSGIENGSPKIIHSCIIHLPFRENSGSSHLIKQSLSAVREVLEDSIKYINTLNGELYHKKLSNIHFVLSSPWITSIARVVSIKGEKEKNVDQKLIQEIIDKEREKTVTDESILSVIEEKVFDVRLNGYSIDEWQEKDAKDIEISYTSSYTNKSIEEKFRSQCEPYISKSKIHFHSSLLLQYMGLQNIYGDHMNYCIVYLHGELTDIVIVRRGFPVFFGSFPFGVQTLIRKISKNTKLDSGVAESMLNMISENHIDAASSLENKKIVTDITEGWKSDLKKILATEIDVNTADYDFIVVSRTHEDYFLSRVREMYPKARVQSLSSDLVQSKVPFKNDSDHIRLLALYSSALTNIKTTKEN